MSRPSKTYMLVFHGSWEDGKLIDIGDDPCFQSPPTWGICRPNVRGSWIQSGDTLVFLCCINHTDEYFLKGWFEVGELISYPDALQRFPERSNVIVSCTPSSKDATWTKDNRKKLSNLYPDESPPEFLSRIKSKQGVFYHAHGDDHCTDEWKCKRIFRCDYKKFDKCLEINTCHKDDADMEEYAHYVVSHPTHWEEVDYLRISIGDIENCLGWSRKLRTPKHQHNALRIDEYMNSLKQLINLRKQQIKNVSTVRVQQITAQIAQLSGIKEDPLHSLLRSTLEYIYKKESFYPNHQVVVIPQSTKEMFIHSDEPSSRIDWDNSTNPMKPRQIFLNCDAANETILWDLLHEFGHLIDGPPSVDPNNEIKSLNRESRAWEIGRTSLIKHPEYLESYDNRTKECLKTYG